LATDPVFRHADQAGDIPKRVASAYQSRTAVSLSFCEQPNVLPPGQTSNDRLDNFRVGPCLSERTHVQRLVCEKPFIPKEWHGPYAAADAALESSDMRYGIASAFRPTIQ